MYAPTHLKHQIDVLHDKMSIDVTPRSVGVYGVPKLHCNYFIIFVFKNKLKTNNVQCNGFIAQVPNLSSLHD